MNQSKRRSQPYRRDSSSRGSRYEEDRDFRSDRDMRLDRDARSDRDLRDERDRDRDRDFQDYQTEYDYDREREVRHMRRDDQKEYRRPRDYYDYADIPERPRYQGSSEYREELDRRYPRQGRKEIHPDRYEFLRDIEDDDIEYRDERRESYAGRGPRNYKRSDERISDEVNEMLTRHSSIDAEDIQVEVRDGEVTLSGSVPEKRMRHLAEDVAESCFGVRDVTNNIRLKRLEDSSRLPLDVDLSSRSSRADKNLSKKSSDQSASPSSNPSH